MAEEARAEAARADVEAAVTMHNDIVATSAPIIYAATKAAANLQALKAQAGHEIAALQDVRSDIAEMREQKAGIATEIEAETLRRDAVLADVATARHEVAELGRKRVAEEGAVDLARLQKSVLTRQAQEAVEDLAEVKKNRDAAGHELAGVLGQLTEVRKRLSLAEKVLREVTEGLDLVPRMALRWPPANPGEENSFHWGENAPRDKNEREEILMRIRPGLARLEPITGAIHRFADQILSRERAQLTLDSRAVADLRDDWQEERKALFARILAVDADGEPDLEPE